MENVTPPRSGRFSVQRRATAGTVTGSTTPTPEEGTRVATMVSLVSPQIFRVCVPGPVKRARAELVKSLLNTTNGSHGANGIHGFGWVTVALISTR